MKAMQLESARPITDSPLRLVERPLPEPGAGELLVEVHCCGVCRTDLHIVEGEVAPTATPRIPGHQIVGRVRGLGRGAARFGPGDRVGVPWLHHTCGECDHCRKDRENLCARAEFTGLHVDGGYAEYTLVHEDFACRLPDGFSDVQAAPLLCAGVIGYRALKLSGIRPGERIGLYGFGASAHIALQVARHWGCEIWVASRSEAHREHALALGAGWAGSAEELPQGTLASAVMFAPAGRLVPLALAALAPGGTLALAGIYMTPVPELPYETLYGERTLRTVANATRRDAADLMTLAGEIPIQVTTHSYRLEDANLALTAVKDSEISGSAVLELEAGLAASESRRT